MRAPRAQAEWSIAMTKKRKKYYLAAIVLGVLALAAAVGLLTVMRRAHHSSTASAIHRLQAPNSRFSYPASESEAKQMLAELGCEPQGVAVVTRLLFNPFVVLGIVLAVATATLLGHAALAKRNIQLNLGNALLAVTLLLAVFQWHASLEQEAMQRYEAEITNANAAESLPSVERLLGRFYSGKTQEANEQIRYVYIHLDNLEYALERYRQGFASASTTARAVMTFAGHCEQPEFLVYARQQVKGYPQFVQTVVTSLLTKTESAYS